MDKVIKVENLSKAYQLGTFGTGTISRDLERYWARVRGKEDPFLKIGEVNDRATKGESNVVWSLKDINFEIAQGDAVGIIGRNGAGKSTLLKILSRITSPTTGSVKVKGRVASLLEVGTGFHPELTGKENIYLNGAILGMRKAEIKRKFDEIVDFSGVERYIDTPVKRYSSGMYVRLAFAVAAHLESEILIIDEVLSVGDAEFQKKCLGKMDDVSKGEGRTVLFVSHNLASIKSLCQYGMVLENGALVYKGEIDDATFKYAELFSLKNSIRKTNNQLTWVGLTKKVYSGTDDIDLTLNFYSHASLTDIGIDFGFIKNFGNYSLHLRNNLPQNLLNIQENKHFDVNLHIDACHLTPGNYKMNVYIYNKANDCILWVEEVDAFDIVMDDIFTDTYKNGLIEAPVLPPFRVSLQNK